LRQSISVVFAWEAILYLPAAILGVSPITVAIVAPIHLFMQFWYHTRLIKRMGIFENFIVTPSHHRVHHAINPEYLDKNYGQILILWDKWFGTFQPELTSVDPVYGVKVQLHTWNPFKINFIHIWTLIKNAYQTSSFSDKITIWFRKTGWMPNDTRPQPQMTVEYWNRQKFDSHPSILNIVFGWFQLINVLVFTWAFFSQYLIFSSSEIVWIASSIFLIIYSFTNVLDRSPDAVAIEIIKNAFIILMLYYGVPEFQTYIFPIAIYILISMTGILVLHSKSEFKKQIQSDQFAST